MKNAIYAYAMLATILATMHSRPSCAQSNLAMELNFDMTIALNCTKQKNVEQCLNKLFGQGIGFTIHNNTQITAVNFPKIRNGSLIINGTKFDSLYNPSINFFPDRGTYSVCGANKPVSIGNLLLNPKVTCICGFSTNGRFERRLVDTYAFVPKNTKLLTGSTTCSAPGEISANAVTILEKTKICGYDFPKDTKFYILESYPAFDAPKNGKIEGKGGNQISIVKGKKYMNDSSTETPCNWEPVPDHVGNEQSSDSELGT